MLADFIIMCAVGIFAITTTCLITYEILRFVWFLLPKLAFVTRLRVVLIFIPIFFIHILSIWFYAGLYFIIENYTTLGSLSGDIMAASLTYESFIERLYFSASTYASLGLGDIFPTKNLRMLASAEVLNGLVLIGWTISFTYLTMEKFWHMPHKK